MQQAASCMHEAAHAGGADSTHRAPDHCCMLLLRVLLLPCYAVGGRRYVPAVWCACALHRARVKQCSWARSRVGRTPSSCAGHGAGGTHAAMGCNAAWVRMQRGRSVGASLQPCSTHGARWLSVVFERLGHAGAGGHVTSVTGQQQCPASLLKQAATPQRTDTTLPNIATSAAIHDAHA